MRERKPGESEETQAQPSDAEILMNRLMAEQLASGDNSVTRLVRESEALIQEGSRANDLDPVLGAD
jgi:hypothetical protein